MLTQKKRKKVRDTSKYKYRCEYCGKPLQSLATLSTHIVSKHPEKTEEFLATGKSKGIFKKLKQGIKTAMEKVEPKAESGESQSPEKPQDIAVNTEQLLKEKEKKIANLQQQIDELQKEGEEMAERTERDAQLDALEQKFGRATDALGFQIQDIQKTVESWGKEKVPQEIEKRIKPIEDKVTSQFAEIRKSTENLSQALNELKSTLTQQVSEQTEGIKKETEGIKAELDETKKKADGVSSLEDKLTSSVTGVLEEKTKAWDEKFAAMPTEEKIKELVNECITDPTSPACQKIDELAQKAAKVSGAPEAETAGHKTSEELLKCPECGPAVTKKIMEALSHQGADGIRERLVQAMSKEGFQTGYEPKEEPKEEENPAPKGF